MEWIEQLSTLVITAVILATIVFALIGVDKVYSGYKESKWQKEYGNKLQENTERAEWENMERLRDKVLLFEEVAKENGLENSIDQINRIISEVDYDTRYNSWKQIETKWNVFALSSMSGGLGSTEKAQGETNEDFDKYEEQKRQELRKKVNKAIEKGR